MRCRYTSLLLALLLPLVVGMRNPTIPANTEVSTVDNHSQAVETVKGELIHHETKKIADSTQSRRLRGRKIGAADVQEVEGTRSELANTGKDISSSNNSHGASKKQGALEPVNQSKNLHGKSQVPKVSSAPYSSELQDTHDHSTATQELLDATAEIFKMMKKDYHSKARGRPPINNNQPLNDHKTVSP